MKLTGAEIIWECLIREGVEVVFGYPGGAILPTYDAMTKYPQIHHVLTRHEQGASHMADGYARATGKVGVAIATSGPGATNLVTGIATAMMDSSPMVCITGQVGTSAIGSDAFQETDVTGVTLPVTKHNYLVTHVEELAYTIREAFHIARTGRPGPVLIDIPKDVQNAATEFLYPEGAIVLPGYRPASGATDSELEQALKLIHEAERPLILAGHGVIMSGATRELQAFVEKANIPVTLTLLGKGGMGSVYLAHDSELDRNVAIKFPEFDDRPDLAAAAIERFRREARAMATVHHPNICPIFDVGHHDGRHYLTMAWIDGQTLSEVAGSLSQAEIVRLVMTTSRALHAAHQAGVVHRDLKPSNVMLDKRGEPIVTDFGLASRAAVSDSGLTHSGLIIGSPAYMAPEQVDAAHDKVGPRTDVYALGVILYQLLTGRRPFDGAGLSVLGKIAAGIRPESPSQIADVSPALEAICLKAMAHQIEDRFESAEALADSLDDWLKARHAASAQARPSRRKTALMAGGMAFLALSSLLMAIANRPYSTEKLPGL